MMQDYELIFDGGSKGNPGEAYGSFLIKAGKRQSAPPIRIRFGSRTNNEAEYLSLLSGLESLIEILKSQKINPKDVTLEIRGDSKLVLMQVEGKWKAKSDRMRSLRDQTQRILRRFKTVRYVHQPRKDTLKVLGH
jgi:ribonuclease HI